MLSHLPLTFGGLGLREAFHVSPAAFLVCCVGLQNLCTQSLASFSDSNISFPFIPEVESATTCLSSLSGGPLPSVDHPSKASQSVFQHSVDLHQLSSLLDLCSLWDRCMTLVRPKGYATRKKCLKDFKISKV